MSDFINNSDPEESGKNENQDILKGPSDFGTEPILKSGYRFSQMNTDF